MAYGAWLVDADGGLCAARLHRPSMVCRSSIDTVGCMGRGSIDGGSYGPCGCIDGEVAWDVALSTDGVTYMRQGCITLPNPAC
jgi:hypothetical protein